MTVVTQERNHATLADTTVAAFADLAFQFFLERLELGEANFNRFQMRFRNGISSCTAGVRNV